MESARHDRQEWRKVTGGMEQRQLAGSTPACGALQVCGSLAQVGASVEALWQRHPQRCLQDSCVSG